MGSWVGPDGLQVLLGEGALVSGGEPVTPSHSSAAGSDEAAGDSVEIRSTMLDRQSKLDTTGFLLLLTSPGKSTVQKAVSILLLHSYHCSVLLFGVRMTLREIRINALTYHLEFR